MGCPKYHIPFSLGELWAGSNGLKCEHKSRCSNRAFTVYLSKEENSVLPQEKGPGAALMIMKGNFGYALCDEHKPKCSIKALSKV